MAKVAHQTTTTTTTTATMFFNTYSLPIFKLFIISILLIIGIESKTLINGTTVKAPTSAQLTAIDLPTGFNPAPSPLKPMLYPFATENSQPVAETATTGWKPIINVITSTQQTLLLQEERLANLQPLPKRRESNITSTTAKTTGDAVVASIVYGAWKPDPPLQPNNSLEAEKAAKQAIAQNHKNTGSNTLFEAKLSGYSDNLSKASSMHKNQKNSQEFVGFRKKTSQATNAATILATTLPVATYTLPISSTTQAIAMTSTVATSEKASDNAANENGNKTYNATTTTIAATAVSGKVWPTDFEYTSKAAASAEDASTETTEMQNDAVDLTELLPSSVDIRHVGVPFENRNSAEETTICVPLTLREKVASNAEEMLDVERIYCFPLPQAESLPTKQQNKQQQELQQQQQEQQQQQQELQQQQQEQQQHQQQQEQQQQQTQQQLSDQEAQINSINYFNETTEATQTHVSAVGSKSCSNSNCLLLQQIIIIMFSLLIIKLDN